MRIYFMRHATAEEPGAGPDAMRALTEQGRREAQGGGKTLQERGAAPSVILTSPRLRARETAGLVARALGSRPRVEIRDALSCGASFDALRQEMTRPQARELLLVAHNPELSSFVSALTGESIAFRPATLCAVDLEPEGARLAWLEDPGSRGSRPA